MVGEYILSSVDLKDPTNTHGRSIRWEQPFWECLCLPLGLALLIVCNILFGSIASRYLILPSRKPCSPRLYFGPFRIHQFHHLQSTYFLPFHHCSRQRPRLSLWPRVFCRSQCRLASQHSTVGSSWNHPAVAGRN